MLESSKKIFLFIQVKKKNEVNNYAMSQGKIISENLSCSFKQLYVIHHQKTNKTKRKTIKKTKQNKNKTLNNGDSWCCMEEQWSKSLCLVHLIASL